MGHARISDCFRRRSPKPVLVAYLTIGEPSVEESADCARAALDAGADLLELGVPFSDPTADGPVIAAASYRAIKNGGSFRAALGVCERLRKTSDRALVIFSYYNPIFAFGDDQAARAAASAGADGFLVVDLPPEEGRELRSAAKREELAMIPLVAPTTGRERERALLSGASGFVYYVSVTGVTGSAAAPLGEAGKAAAELRARAGLPVVVGFGIRTPEQARAVADAGVDGIVVGTEIVRVMGESPDAEARRNAVFSLVSRLRAALDA